MTIKTKIGYVKGDPGPKIVDIIEKSHIGNAHIFTAVLEDGSHVDFPPLYDSDMTKAEFVNPGGTGEVLKAKMVGEAITSVLEGLTEDADGKLLYKGNPIISDSEDLFTGTVVDYEAAEAAGKLKDGTLVALEDDEEDEPSYVNPDDFDLTNGILSLSMGIKEKIDNSHTKIDQVTERLSDIYEDGFYSNNVLKTTLESGSKNNITYTKNADGSYTLNSSGASANTWLILAEKVPLKGGTYKVLGKTTWGTPYAQFFNASGTNISNDVREGNTFSSNDIASASYIIAIGNGTALDNVVIKPFITTKLDATVEDYTPYAESNVELTAKLSQQEAIDKNIIGGDEWVNGKSYSIYDSCIYNNKIYRCILQHTSSTSILPTNTTYWRETNLSTIMSALMTEVNYNRKTIPHGVTSIGPGAELEFGYLDYIGVFLIVMQGGQGIQTFIHPYTTGGAICNVVNSNVTMTQDNTAQKYKLKNNHGWAAAYLYFISQGI